MYKLQWNKIGVVAPQEGYEKNIGTAGLLKGVIDNKLVFGGGANFPGGLPVDGGTKVTHKDIYLYEIKDNEHVLLDQIQYDYPLAYGPSANYKDKLYYIANKDESSSDILELTIKENKLNLKYLIVNEAGASVYSASKIAAEEFPDLDVTVRGAISIGRRIQDPLAELVKIDPKSIGVGMYQHDVNQSKLDESLDNVISHVVNNVGANINTASWALLSHISGIKKTVAKNIVEYRKENGNFKNRKEILKVKGVGPKAYEQMAGFLVIPEGENILDNTVIHPESYAIAEALLEKIGFSLEKYNNELNEARERLKSFDYKKFAEENNFGAETVKDVYEALLKDRRDPRDDFEKPLLKSDILNIDNLEVGMELEGTVRNVVKFGAFVDIGLKNDALLHISEISNKYIDDPSKVLAVGQIIKVRIKDVDKDRGRVGLTKKEQN